MYSRIFLKAVSVDAPFPFERGRQRFRNASARTTAYTATSAPMMKAICKGSSADTPEA